MKYFFALVFALPLLSTACAATETEVSSEKSGIEYALAKITREGHQVDVQNLSQELKLPDLNKGLVWTGPFAGYQTPQFFAHYDPQASEFGIKKIVIEWTATFRWDAESKSNKPVLFKNLTVFMKEGACPSVSTMEQAFGEKVTSFQRSSPHGGASYPVSFFSFPLPNGEPISASFNGDMACDISIGRFECM